MEMFEIPICQLSAWKSDGPLEDLGTVIRRSFVINAERTAFISAGRILTFSDLSKIVTQRISELDSHAIPQGTTIILQLDRGIEFISYAIACILAGYTFAPVSPSEATVRIEQIFRNLKPTAVVRSQMDATSVQAISQTNPKRTGSVYILHTSGSTGTPKAIPVGESGLLSFLSWYSQALGFDKDSRINHSSPPTFDFSIPEYLMPLLSGGVIVCPPRPISVSIADFWAEIVQAEVTHLHIVPTLLSYLLQFLGVKGDEFCNQSNIKLTICNGEELSIGLAREYFQRFARAKLVNSYGPTETCVAVTANVMTKCPHEQHVSIGQPSSQINLYLADPTYVDESVFGELVISGPQVSAGYLGNEDRAEASFFHLGEKGGQSPAYRTGDNFEYSRQEKSLYYRGRRDRQIKYRGVRIELLEIERACLQVDGCQEVAALVVQGAAQENDAQKLLVFVSPGQLEVNKIEQQLRRSLPPNMMPSNIVVLDAMPATPNGKIDRQSLEQLALSYEKTAYRDSKLFDNRGSGILDTMAVLQSAIQKALGRKVDARSDTIIGKIDSLEFLNIQLELEKLGLRADISLDDFEVIRLQDLSNRLSRTSSSKAGDEKGDFEGINVLRDIFDRIEAENPDVVLFQSSLWQLRTSRPDIFIDEIVRRLISVSKKSRIFIPSYSFSFLSSRYYDHLDVPMEAGALVKSISSRILVNRTRHPVYSFLTFGGEPNFELRKDFANFSPFGDGSFFDWLSKQKSLGFLLGTRALATSHRAEHLAKVPYHRFVKMDGNAKYSESVGPITAQVYARDVPGEAEYSLCATDQVRMMGLISECSHEFQVSGLPAYVVNLACAERTMHEALERNPFALLHEKNIPMVLSLLASHR